jgi:cytochrome d ubiquinol oxidase subunit II
MRQRARRLAQRIAPVTGLLVLAFVSWTHAIAGKGALLNPVEFGAVLVAFAAIWLVYTRSEGWAFAATTVTMAACVLAIFTDLYPRVMVSSTSPAYSLTVHNTASGRYALTVMTVVVVIFLPFVLAYQAWSYYIFRRRVSRHEFLPRSGQDAPARPGAAVPPQAGPSQPGATRSRSG